MKVEQYQVKNNMSMDPMHDSYADEIRIENNCLIIVYDKLDEGVLGPDGLSEYKNKKLTVKYDFQTQCDAKFYYGKNKCLWLDMLEDINKFNKITKDCIFMSYKYSVDSFNEITLDFEIHKGSRTEYKKYKYWGLEISLDAANITYIWE
jgi:hypothetical protein